MKEKFKLLIDKMKTAYGEAYSNCKITMIMADVATLCGCIYVLMEESRDISYNSTPFKVAEWIMLFFIFLSAGCLCVESFRKDFYEKGGSIKKSVGVALSAVISGVLVSFNTGKIFGLIGFKNPTFVNETVILSWTFAYFVLIVLLSFYMRYKESSRPLEKYFVSVVTEIIQINIAWGILSVGFLLLSAAFETLIGGVIGLFTVPQILILGLFAVPRFIIGIFCTKDEIGRFFEVLIKYVALIITIVGAAIIYLYIIKLIFTRLPSNEIFAITSALFFVAIPVGFAATAFARDTFLQKIAYALPYIYAPFILLQAYSIIARIAEYGLTPARYMGVVLVILEIIYTVVYALNKNHIDKVILIMMAVTVITTLIPGINLNALSRLSQKRIVMEFINNDGSKVYDTVKEKNRITGAYDYLMDEYGNDYLKSFLSQDDKDRIAEINREANKSTVSCYNLVSDRPFLPTDGYNYIAEFYTRTDSFDVDSPPSNITLDIDGREYGPFDMSGEYESVKNRCIEEDTANVTGYDVVKVSDEYELIFTEVSITEDSEDGELLDFTVRGYLLTNSL